MSTGSRQYIGKASTTGWVHQLNQVLMTQSMLQLRHSLHSIAQQSKSCTSKQNNGKHLEFILIEVCIMKMDDRAKKKKGDSKVECFAPFRQRRQTRFGEKWEKKAKKAEGAICKELDNALQELHIHRQQYHGGSFIGNHIHKMLQVKLWNLQFNAGQLRFHVYWNICALTTKLPLKRDSLTTVSHFM